MIALIRSELLQMQSLRSTYGVGLLIVLCAIGLTWIDLLDANELVSARQQQAPLVFDTGLILAFIGAILAAARVAGEYRHGTIASRVLAAPRRLRLLTSKLLTWSAVAIATAALTTALAIVVTFFALKSKDLALILGLGDAIGIATRITVAATLFTALGVLIGFVSRSQQAAMVIVFGEFLFEKIFSGLLGGLTQYLPFGLLDQLLDVDSAYAVPAGFLLAAYVALLSTVAGVLLRRRDVGL